MSIPDTADRPVQPAVSVVIPTFNRARLLREVLESLFEQNFDPARYEIIVVDNASTDETPRMMEELKRSAPCRFTYRYLTEDHGPTGARNLGVALASAPIVAFTDSDCRTHPDWLARGTEAFTGDVAFMTGTVLPKPDQRVRFFSGFQHEVTREHASYPTCNAMYRRDLFLEMGGFDENLYFTTVFNDKPVECSDTDLAWRIKNRGGRNAFVPEAIGYHDVGVREPWLWVIDPFRLFSLPALVKKHPQLRRHLLHGGVFFMREAPFFYLALAGLMLGVVMHPAFLLLMLPFPAALAFRLRKNLTARSLPKVAGQMVLLAARLTFASAGLVYGSVRFRSLVL